MSRGIEEMPRQMGKIQAFPEMPRQLGKYEFKEQYVQLVKCETS